MDQVRAGLALPTDLSLPGNLGALPTLTRSSACWLMKFCCWAASCLASMLESRGCGCGCGGTTMAAGWQVGGAVSTGAKLEALCPLSPLGLWQDPPSSSPY